ncbi:MAG: lysophospholipid acyltransferase family protein, partial [Fimbriimonadaceae bacterium]|nr:lysophospholipid acyltransferase family protein [Fimbriimonadaceae bacterium]
TPERLEETTVVEGFHHVEQALAQGRGALMITGHFGNWERISAWLSHRGVPLSVVARDANQAEINDLINSLRQGPGTRVIPRGNAARPILERLRANELIGILPDQNSQEIYIPFFGHPAGTVLGPGVLAERSGAPVIPVACVRVGVGRYRIRFDDPLVPEPVEGPRGEGTMRAIHAWLESVIREHPEQWLWLHDRWRSARREGLL